MGTSFCKSPPVLTDYGRYQRHRKLFVYTSENGMRLIGMKTVGLEIYCYLESCVHNDLQKQYLPRYYRESAVYEPFIVIQASSSNPSIYKFVDIRVTHTQLFWVPFVAKSIREVANKNSEQEAQQIKMELTEIFSNPPIFTSVNNVMF